MGANVIYEGDRHPHSHKNTLLSHPQSLRVRWEMMRGALKNEVCTTLLSFQRKILEENLALSGIL